jgi:hypothetical protein
LDWFFVPYYASIGFVPKTKVTWLERFLILCARPCGAGRSRFNIVAPSTRISFTKRLAFSTSPSSFFACQLAIAESKSFSKRRDASFELNFKIAKARSIASPPNWQAKNEDGDVEKANLFVKEIRVDGATMLKRLRPAPQGRAHRIRKRSNHVTLVLGTNPIEA